MDTEHKFNVGDAVRFYKDGKTKRSLWYIRSFHGNRIYAIQRTESGQFHWEWAYEQELELVPMTEVLRESIAHAKR